MPETYKFAPDPESPAFDMKAYVLKLDPVGRPRPEAKMQLVRLHRAVSLNHRVAVEPGAVDGLPSVRVLKLWYAMAPDRAALSLEDAIDRHGKWNRPQTMVFSRSCGGLAITSCLGMAEGMDTMGVIVPSAPTIRLNDFNREVDFEELVDYHLDSFAAEGFDSNDSPLSANVDRELVRVLQLVPQSRAKAL
jgi:hypothetical protein